MVPPGSHSTDPNCVIISKPLPTTERTEKKTATAEDQMMAAECILTGRLGFKMEISVRSWIDLPPELHRHFAWDPRSCGTQAFSLYLILQKPEVS